MTTPAWRLALQTASFRGVPFFVESNTANGLGRRVAVHGYAKRDETFTEDMGRARRSHTLPAYVIGPDYMRARDALEEALAKPGAGELVHPKRGRIMVVVTDASCTESSAEGGMATFQINFELAGENEQPASAPDTRAQVESAAGTASTAAHDEFTGTYSTDGVPEFVRESALSDIGDVLDAVQEEVRSVVPDIGQLGTYTSEVSSLSTQLSNIIGTPTRMADEIIWQVSRIGVIASRPGDALDSLGRLFDFGDDYKSISQTTPSRRRQLQNRDATVALTRRAAVIEAALASSVTTFASSNEALATRALIVGEIDEQMNTALDAAYTALADLRVAVVRDLTTRAAQLTRINTITLAATMPAALLAYRLYGDAARGDEIVERNNIKHPLFVPGGRPLEVFSA